MKRRREASDSSRKKKNVEVYSVEQIIDKRDIDGWIEYLVSWVGFDSSWNTWEPAINLRETAADAIADYEADQGENDVPEWESSTEDQDSKEESGSENDEEAKPILRRSNRGRQKKEEPIKPKLRRSKRHSCKKENKESVSPKRRRSKRGSKTRNRSDFNNVYFDNTREHWYGQKRHNSKSYRTKIGYETDKEAAIALNEILKEKGLEPPNPELSSKRSYNTTYKYVYRYGDSRSWYGQRVLKGIIYRTRSFQNDKEAAGALNELMKSKGFPEPNPQLSGEGNDSNQTMEEEKKSQADPAANDDKVENSILHLKLQISKKNEEMMALKMSKLQEEKHQLELQLKLLEKSKES